MYFDMKLRDWIHPAVQEQDLSKQVQSYLDLEVVAQYQSVDPESSEFAYWLGVGTNVFHWVLLENGRGVGWNESPAWGWQFYVQSVAKTERSMELKYNS